MLQTTWDSFKIKIGPHMLHVTRTGKGSGKPALLMLHGHTDHGLCWTNLARDLEADYDCILPDMVGHGQSSRLNGSRTLHTMTAEISSLVFMLGIQKMQIIGHSMGAHLAAMVAAAIPNKVQRIVLEDPPWSVDADSIDFDPNTPKVHQWIADIERWKKASTAAVAREKSAEVNWDTTDLHAYAESRQQCDLALYGGLKWQAVVDWEQTLAQVRCPIMLIRGNANNGGLVDEDGAARCLAIQPTLTDLHVPTASHHVRRDTHTQVSKAIRDFLI